MRRVVSLRAVGAAAGALALAVTAAACASLPTSGNVRLSTLHGSSSQAQLGVQVLPVPPNPDWSPQDVVHGFLAASGSISDDFAVAREYLAAGFAQRWRPGTAATVVDSPQVWRVPTRGHLITSGGALDTQVNVTTQYLATMTSAGQGAGNVVVSPGRQIFQFAMTQQNGAWRIEAIYRNGMPTSRRLLLLTRFDFERMYQPTNLYYYPAADSVSNVLIPEPVYIPPQAATGSSGIVRAIVKPLFYPPPQTSWLYGAATTAFPPGTELLGVQVVGGVKAVVDVGGAAAKADAAQRERMAAELYWSLTSLPYTTSAVNQIRSVVLEVNHRTWKQLLPGNDAARVPRGTGSPLYLQTSGPLGTGIKAAAGKKLSSVTVSPAIGGPFTAIAAMPGTSGAVVLAGCRGRYISLLPQWHGARQTTVTLPASSRCTALSWDDAGNLWAAAGSGIYLVHGAASGGLERPAIVSVVCPACSGAITSLRVAPDGVRVALIERSGAMAKVLVAAVSKGQTFTYLGQTSQMLQVGSDISDPRQLAWLDPDHLLVLGRSGGTTGQPATGQVSPAASQALFEVSLNGSGSIEVATPRRVTAIAASWPAVGKLPQVAVATAGTAGKPSWVWTSTGGLNHGWSHVAQGITPVFPG